MTRLGKRSWSPKRFDLASFLRQRREETFVFLESSRLGEEDRRSLFFSSPVKELTWSPGQGAKAFLAALEQALKEGFWLAGFFTYEAGYLFEPRLRRCFRWPEKTPLAWFGVFRAPEILPAGPVKRYLPPKVSFENLRLSLEKEEYLEAIKKIKDFIASGDTYQVNFTLKYHFSCSVDPVELYLALRPKQKVRYAALLKTPSFSVVSLSPELFLRREGRRLWTSPMKGTAPRGRFTAEDEALSSWLASDRKNQAENVMIVDLLRNDLGRVCLPGTVYVRELFKVERYETVFQMISTIEGRLAQEGLFPLFEALFPCGSVTGAPKLRTMEIIADLEKEPRGVYTGALGYFSPSGDFVFNVPIRTVVLSGKEGEFGLGSGVVWDSEPEKEWEECLLKARFLLDPYEPFALVETMRFEPEKGLPLLPYHLRRLFLSARYFDFSFEEDQVKRFLKEALKGLSVPAKVRLLLYEDGGLELETSPLPEVRSPVRLGLMKRSVEKHERFLFHKTTYRPWYEAPRRLAEKEGLFDVIFFNEDGELTEGTITNLFLEIEGRLFTPPLSAGLLPGVLRESLLERGKALEASLFLPDLQRATRVWVGNAVRGLVPVSEIVSL